MNLTQVLSSILWIIITATITVGLAFTFGIVAEYFGWDKEIKNWLSRFKI